VRIFFIVSAFSGAGEASSDKTFVLTIIVIIALVSVIASLFSLIIQTILMKLDKASCDRNIQINA
jgi:hypothetical protein